MPVQGVTLPAYLPFFRVKYDIYKVKFLLLHLVVTSSSHVAPYVRIYGAYLNTVGRVCVFLPVIGSWS